MLNIYDWLKFVVLHDLPSSNRPQVT